MQFLTAQQMLEMGAEMNLKAFDESLPERLRIAYLVKAEKLYNDVLELAPTEPMALASLGSLYTERGLWGGGIALLEAAVREDPTDFHALNALGCAYRKSGKVEKAHHWLSKAIAVNPKDPRVLNNMAGTFVNNGTPDTAIEWAQKALAVDPNYVDAMLNMGMAYLEKGEYELGWAGLEASMNRQKSRRRDYGEGVTYWTGQKDKTVVVFGEQGVGDEVMFAHCLPDLIALSKEAIIDCHVRLVETFKRSFPGLKVYGTRKEEPTWRTGVKADHYISIGSLPSIFRNSKQDFEGRPSPYLKADPELIEHYRGKSGKLRVGLSWIGGTRSTHLHLRSLPPDTLKPILTVPGIEWVSLQYTNDAHLMVDEMKRLYGCDITHDAEMNADLDKLFACMMGLDLIVTVPTSNVHFAGALGIPAWIMTPTKASWRYCGDNITDFYPQHTIYRQREHGQWDDVMTGLALDLAALRNAKTRQAAE